MIKILFVCLGNICRSPMAEFVFRDMIKKKGLESMICCESSATSTEEIGNSVHYGTKKKLKEVGIIVDGKQAVQLKRSDYDKYDLLLGMEQRNITNMMRILGSDSLGKVKRLLDFSERPRDIADPWYTGDFEITYQDVYEGCDHLLTYLINNYGIHPKEPKG
ncbi:low molecular weight protein-tyrosine-phosphatase [Lachnoclostridium sp.]|uniref:low molecular weight protein-tyrosine-phosphatase n=1 Tax=Lachnoclostridium sp. TaxID=2028282 RepID=UPI00289C1A9A|nr:low molecular weight protein-tyrosine-phosphatase [Lachnoclostridium sp.]